MFQIHCYLILFTSHCDVDEDAACVVAGAVGCTAAAAAAATIAKGF